MSSWCTSGTPKAGPRGVRRCLRTGEAMESHQAPVADRV